MSAQFYNCPEIENMKCDNLLRLSLTAISGILISF